MKIILKSDLDYTIYINPSLDNYDIIYKDICYLAFFKIRYYKRFIIN